MAESKNFDLVGTLITEKGLTGENLSLKIFSYLDISSRLRIRTVSKTWYRFLTRQKKMWIAEVRKIVSLLEYIDKVSPTNPFFHRGLSRTWSSLLESLEQNGTFNDIIFVYMKIQCIGFFGHYYNKFILDLEPSPGVKFRYRITNPSPMFRESYVGKDVRKETLRFIEEQVKICYELAAFGGPEDQIHSIEELQNIAVGFEFSCVVHRRYIRYVIKDSSKFRLILKICCHIQKEQTNELRQKINKLEQNDFRQPKRFKSV